jgi:hypothetical protein
MMALQDRANACVEDLLGAGPGGGARVAAGMVQDGLLAAAVAAALSMPVEAVPWEAWIVLLHAIAAPPPSPEAVSDEAAVAAVVAAVHAAVGASCRTASRLLAVRHAWACHLAGRADAPLLTQAAGEALLRSLSRPSQAEQAAWWPAAAALLDPRPVSIEAAFRACGSACAASAGAATASDADAIARAIALLLLLQPRASEDAVVVALRAVCAADGERGRRIGGRLEALGAEGAGGRLFCAGPAVRACDVAVRLVAEGVLPARALGDVVFALDRHGPHTSVFRMRAAASVLRLSAADVAVVRTRVGVCTSDLLLDVLAAAAAGASGAPELLAIVAVAVAFCPSVLPLAVGVARSRVRAVAREHFADKLSRVDADKLGV